MTNRASASIRTRHVQASAQVEVSPAGLLAIGALVCGILLCTVPIVRAARR
ncbi:hypothetical protein QCN27_14765 [Cereibacter sp. SYSU M97828]|nr:hypothetical protein [Cereibacter flavus]